MDYTLIIPAYNEEAELPATLASVRAAMAMALPRAGEVIVVDNNSKDRTAAVAEALGARVVFEPYNQISRARNAGGNAAVGRYLIWIDADTRIPPELVRLALEQLESGQVVGGGAAVAYDCELDGFSRRALTAWNWLSRTQKLAAGSFVWCLQEAFLATGGYSEEVYASEEIWFSKALKRWARPRGLRFEIITSARVITSSRKMQWYSPGRLALIMCGHLLFPWSVRSRRLCAFWYHRPH
ncbi:MAG: glycosyltransferase [Verrucomicrobiota bacterium]|nr:glycosyltransferase [Verrucomicrobiota bacterium]